MIGQKKKEIDSGSFLLTFRRKNVGLIKFRKTFSLSINQISLLKLSHFIYLFYLNIPVVAQSRSAPNFNHFSLDFDCLFSSSNSVKNKTYTVYPESPPCFYFVQLYSDIFIFPFLNLDVIFFNCIY